MAAQETTMSMAGRVVSTTCLEMQATTRLRSQPATSAAMRLAGRVTIPLFGSDTSSSNFDNSLQGDAGDDILHAGAVGSTLNGGLGADQLISSAADDQMTGGRDPDTFELDGAQDRFVYGAGAWGSDTIFGFEDGVDLFDMSESGLTFGDLAIVNEDFQTTITSSQGTITIFENFGEPVTITAADFLFV
jgi:Ca2+-binding RTX toxin-like protein